MTDEERNYVLAELLAIKAEFRRIVLEKAILMFVCGLVAGAGLMRWWLG